MLFINEHEAPRPLRSMDAAALGWLTVGHTTLLGIAAAVACLAVGFMVFLGAWSRLFLSLSILLALAGWVAGQNLGVILTGSSTDVGTGPVLIVLALAFWPAGRARGRPEEPREGAAASLPARQGRGEQGAAPSA